MIFYEYIFYILMTLVERNYCFPPPPGVFLTFKYFTSCCLELKIRNYRLKISKIF